MGINQSIAKNLRDLRKREGLSIGALAERTGLSKAAISQIEQGKGNPTISTISKLASELHVPYSAVLHPRDTEAAVQFADDVPLQVAEDGKFRAYSYYSATPDRDFDILTLELEAGCTHVIAAAKDATDYIILNKGIVIIEVGDLSYFLMEGDSISLGNAEGCVIKNDSSEKAQATCIRHYI